MGLTYTTGPKCDGDHVILMCEWMRKVNILMRWFCGTKRGIKTMSM